MARKDLIRLSSICVAGLVLVLSQAVRGQVKWDPKDAEGRSRTFAPQSILDRAGGVHNKSNIGSYFVNRGKLYASDYSQGPTFEWPIGSQHEFVYRANPWVGIPGNVVQGRWYEHCDWEAAAGYHNRDSAQPAFSDRPWTWPENGWHVTDPYGAPVVVSDQDSYCVYNDSSNTVAILNLQINQTGLAYSSKKFRDMIIYIFEVTNRSAVTYDSVYFGIYSDIAAGGSYNAKDYTHRRMAFDKVLKRLYLWKPGNVSIEWPGYPAGEFGVIMLQTPKVNGVELGVTDWHYSKYKDEQDIDWVQYGQMSSSPQLYNDVQLGSKFFHLGVNAPDVHYDDPATIPAGGDDLTSVMGSGPYTLAPGDTLRFITAWIAGATDADIETMTTNAYTLLDHNLAATKPPVAPHLSAVPGNGKVSLTWDNSSEPSRDLITGTVNFEGYHLYRSTDRGSHWDQIDRNTQPTGPEPVPLATFDKIDGITPNAGLSHGFVDSTVMNGFEYWYSVTAYTIPDADNLVQESPIGRSGDFNVAVVIPRSDAAGRTPVTSGTVQHGGAGTAVMNVTVTPLDVPQCGGQSYTMTFSPVATLEGGNLRSIVQVSLDTNTASAETFSLSFSSPTTYILKNLTQGSFINRAGTYTSGAPILFNGIRLILTDTASNAADRPLAGDSIVIRPGVQLDANLSGRVLGLQPLFYGAQYSTSNGLLFAIKPADSAGLSTVSYLDTYQFSTTAAQSRSVTVSDLDRVKVVPNPYLVSSAYEQEFGILRREPIRQLKFNNLPPICTIHIFTLAGDRVKTIVHNSDSGTETWDMRSDGNREIASGVYLFLVKTDTAEKLSRFAVIK